MSRTQFVVILILFLLAAINVGVWVLVGNQDHQQSNGYSPGKAEQKQYCLDNHWTYESKTNSCKR